MKNIRIDVSEDKLEARISVEEKEENFPSKAEIYKYISEAGIVFGIDKQVIEKIAAERHNIFGVVFARGKPPDNGENAKLIWYLDLISPAKPAITADGKADFKKMKQLAIVRENQDIVSKLPATEGVSGRTVMGETILIPGRDIILPAGENTGISDDGLTLYSKIDGYAFLKSGKVHVSNVYHIKGDVDFRTGDVKFGGTILIEGDVRSGFRVDATNSIYINGNVGAADIYSQKGDVVVQMGILGKGRAKVLAGGSLYTGFVQDAKVSVKKDIVIEHYSINSNVYSGGKVTLTQNEGLIRGGKIFAGQGLEAIEIGSSQNIPTEVGISENYQETDSLKLNIKKLEDLKSRLSLLNKRKAFLKLLQERVSSLSDEKRRELEKISREIENVRTQIMTLENQKETLNVKNSNFAHYQSIIVKGKLHKGVTITLGHEQYVIENLYQGVKIYQKGQDILIEKMA